MKILVTSDWHLDASTAGLRRLNDVRDAAWQTVDYAKSNNVDVYIHLGDLMNPDSGSRVFACLEVVTNIALHLAMAGIESHWLAGNHDVIEDGTDNTTLTPLKPLMTFSHAFKARIYIHEEVGHTALGDHRGRARLLTLPYCALARAYDPTAMVEELLQVGFDQNIPLIIAAHMTDLPGIIPGSETKDMSRGRGMAFPIDACRKLKNPLLMLNGHFHDRQVWNGVRIPGSLERLTFGEQNNNPGWMICEV